MVGRQKEFVTGKDSTRETKALLGKVMEKVRGHNGFVLFTKDVNGKEYLVNPKGRDKTTDYCFCKTEGCDICDELKSYIRLCPIDKNCFGSEALVRQLKSQRNLEEITLIGLYTDISIISCAIMLRSTLPDVRITVDATCCIGFTKERHSIALRAMEACQIEIRRQ